MIAFLKQIARAIKQNKAALFNYDVDEQAEFMRKLGTPNDDIERSYFQYKCQMKLLGGFTAFIYGLASIPLLMYYRIRLKRVSILEDALYTDALFFYHGQDDIIPDSIKAVYEITQLNDFQSRMALNKDDTLFLRELSKRHPWAWHFRLKCLLKVAIYSYHIRQYNPQVIIVSEEYSFTSSVLTVYCERLGVEHINVMHGEKLYDMTDSFFHFHKCYVWDEHYKALFIDLFAEPTQFTVEKPPAQLPWSVCKGQKAIDYTYYLGVEKHKILEKIFESLLIFLRAGYVVAVRPHPRYSSLDEVKAIFSDFIIEDNTQISVRDSVLRTKNVVSLYSTVLSQAKTNGVNIIVDDVTHQSDYNKLHVLRYYIVSQPHNRLSEELERLEKLPV
jgi:hypothetical protein